MANTLYHLISLSQTMVKANNNVSIDLNPQGTNHVQNAIYFQLFICGGLNQIINFDSSFIIIFFCHKFLRKSRDDWFRRKETRNWMAGLLNWHNGKIKPIKLKKDKKGSERRKLYVNTEWATLLHNPREIRHFNWRNHGKRFRIYTYVRNPNKLLY